MATQRVLQLLRSSQTYVSFAAAKSAIEALTGRKDGEIVLARYGTGTPSGEQGSEVATAPFLSAIGVYDAGHTKWTVFNSSDEIEAAIQALQTELDNTQAGAGLGTGGAYTAPTSGEAGYEIISDGTAPANLNAAINKVADYVYDTITGMDYSLNVNGASDSATTLTKSDASKVISAINQTDGQIAAGTTDAVDLVLTGYANDGTTNTGAISASDTIESAFNKLENSVSAVGVTSPNKTIDVTNNGRDIDVNIDGTTIVADANDGTLSTALKVLKVIPSGTAGTDEVVDSTLPTNVREAYRLVYGSSTTAIGKQIDIYKDSALTNVYLGTTGDSLSGEDSTSHESASSTVVTGTGSESLNFVYHLENGNYKMEKVDVESFLQESEFGNGLDVDSTNHTVSVKAYDGITVDANGVSVTTGDGLELTGTSPNKAVAVKIDSSDDTNAYLSVGASGVALNGDAIDTKILGARTTITEVAAGTETTADGTDFIKVVKTAGSGSTPDSYAISTQGIKDYVAGQLTNTAISAEGDNVYIAAAVDANNNKKINVTGTYGAFNTPTAQSNSLSATTNGIAKAEDVATAVNTVIGNLDGSATATAEANNQYSVLTSVTEVDGVISKGAEVTLAAVAKTGAAADVSYDDTNSVIGTAQAPVANVQAAIEALDGRIDALGTDALESVTSANAGIAVGTKSNHSQELTLTLDDSTTGTGTELTGTNNALTITNDGLFLSNIWDCGTFGAQS